MSDAVELEDEVLLCAIEAAMRQMADEAECPNEAARLLEETDNLRDPGMEEDRTEALLFLRRILSALRAKPEGEPVAWPDREAVVRAIREHVRGEHTAEAAGMDDITLYGFEQAADDLWLQAAAEITRLRSEHATAVGRAMTSNAHKNETERLLIAEREKTARLRSLVEEAKGVVGPFGLAGGTLSSRWQDHETHWQVALSYPLTVAHLRAARSLLDKLKEG